MGIGQRLREAREKADLTLGQVGQYEGVGKSYLSRLELEVNQPPTWLLIAKLARRYHTSTDYLLGLTDDPSPPAPAANQPAVSHFPRSELQRLHDDLPPDQQAALLAIARSMADAEERARRQVVRALVDRLFDDVAERVGEEEAEALMAAIDAAERGHDPAALADWLQRHIAAHQKAPDQG